MVLPFKPITEKDNDQAHIDKEAVPHLQYAFASAEHKFLIDKILEPGKGVTYDIFNETPVEAVEDVPPELDEDGNEIQKPEKAPEEVLPKYIEVPEVVREGRMHFFKVPKLGSYLAIKLEYESCLFEQALDAGVIDQLAVNERLSRQHDEKQAFEQSQQILREQVEAEGETFKPEVREWEVIETKPYLTKKSTFVVCINTMGQDRKFSQDNRLFALRAVQKFRDRWEESERENLKSDIAAKIQRMESLKIYKEIHEVQDTAELELRAEAIVQNRGSSEPMTEEMKQHQLKKARLQVLAKTFFDPDGIITH